jgi:hypothetical protein
MMRVMPRLNLTLDVGTENTLKRHARRSGQKRAALARELLREALARREAIERQRKLASDYAAGREDARRLLDELEVAQTDLLDDDR